MAKGADKATPAVPTAKAAKQDALARVAETPVAPVPAPATVSDMGWKGPKPGEISANDWVYAKDNSVASSGGLGTVPTAKVNEVTSKGTKQLVDYVEANPKSGIARHFTGVVSIGGSPSDAANATYRYIFKPLEDADISRKYTGKVANALHITPLDTARSFSLSGLPKPNIELGKRSFQIAALEAEAAVPGIISKHLKELEDVPGAIETYLGLLPGWGQSLDELVAAARSLA